ncbi:radical SAM protein [Streptomyces sp. PSKA30]|uniref:radical SAM protein n=1 Tax=Streptomyces sp. PSKA30 TaxID=2874597 RepID=UPI001CD05B91|nr:radical SAM protein [Streptomyces sp. PSKA30]MBZ9638646.1 radical SAM protein [Streptomyces sp. PSKA30]
MFNLAILKVTSFCNLDCTYCYMFNQMDKTFEKVINNMPLDTALASLDRIERHCQEHEKKVFHITLHGGEPSLWPYENFVGFFKEVDRIRSKGYKISVSMQTNGLKISPELLRLLSASRTTLGVSLDGPQSLNDAARTTKNGRGSYERVMRTVESILDSEHAHLLHGFLSVAQPQLPPIEYFEWANSLPLRRLDVLWPLEFNYGNYPWKMEGLTAYSERPRYGAWFSELFDLWWNYDDPDLHIRYFYECLYSLMGSGRHIESIVNDRIPIVVVNTDGGIEYHDYLRSYSDGGTRTNFNVHRNDLTDLANDPGFDFLLNLHKHMPKECKGCAHESLCGGGLLAGRADRGDSIPRKKSVLCLDEYLFFSHLKERLSEVLQGVGAPLEMVRHGLTDGEINKTGFSPRLYFAELASGQASD